MADPLLLHIGTAWGEQVKTTPQDKVAIIVTAPLTQNEQWTSFQTGELRVFVNGQAAPF